MTNPRYAQALAAIEAMTLDLAEAASTTHAATMNLKRLDAALQCMELDRIEDQVAATSF